MNLTHRPSKLLTDRPQFCTGICLPLPTLGHERYYSEPAVGVIGLLPDCALAQTTDPLVGSWNFKVTVTGGCTTNCKYIGMIAFNQGGTVVEQRGTAVEYSGLGYVERTALGTWRSTGTSVYRFRMKNFVFDSTGKLSAFIVGISDVTLGGATLNFFSGSGTAQIFKASGTLIGATTFTIAGTRF